MKIAYASDLHLEFGAIDPNQLITDADYLFLAGDTAEARSYFKAINPDSGDYSTWKPRLYDLFDALSKHYKKVIIILGNHEYYHSRVGKAEKTIRKFCSNFSNVTMLQNECMTLEGKKVYGATLWTDMGLMRADPLIEFKLKISMNDFRCITYQSGQGFRKFTPIHAASIHNMCLKTIEKEKPNIILQHHAPCHLSVPEMFKGHELNPAYVSSELEDMLIDKISPELIIHGHIHGVHDYIWSNTRVLGNSRGYVGMEDTDSFKVKVVEV